MLLMVGKKKTSWGLALPVGERKWYLPSNVFLLGPQWCFPVYSCWFPPQTTLQGRHWPAVLFLLLSLWWNPATKAASGRKGLSHSSRGTVSGLSEPEVVRSLASTVGKQGGMHAATPIPFSVQSGIPARIYQHIQWVGLPASGSTGKTTLHSHAQCLQVSLDPANWWLMQTIILGLC